jgi:hypothetical protein
MDALPAKAHGLLRRLSDARLLILRDEHVVEVAHEALLRKWPWLKGQLDAERVFLIGKQQLEEDLRDWQAAADNDKVDALLTGLKLARARDWLVEHSSRLTADERAFIQASAKREGAEKRRRERTRRLITLGSITAALVLSIVATWAYRAQVVANQAHDTATTNLRRAYGPTLQVALGLYKSHDIAQMRKLLSATPTSFRKWEWKYLRNLMDQSSSTLRTPLEVSALAFSRDGNRIFAGEKNGVVAVIKLDGYPIQRQLGAHKKPSKSSIVEIDGQKFKETVSSDAAVKKLVTLKDNRFASVGNDGTLAIWDPNDSINNYQSPLFNDPQSSRKTIALSRDGLWLASATERKQLDILSAQDDFRSTTVSFPVDLEPWDLDISSD